MSLSREQLNSIRPSFPTEKVDATEFGDGETLTVRSMALGQVDVVNTFRSDNTDSRFTQALIASSLVDDNGDLLFDVDKADDLAVIAGWPRTLTERVSKAIIDMLSGLDAAKAVDDAKGNSEAGPTGS